MIKVKSEKNKNFIIILKNWIIKKIIEIVLTVKNCFQLVYP